MADPVAWTVVERGWAVAASDGSEVGNVVEVLGDPEADIFDGLAVGVGTVLTRPVYVPSEQVGAIEEGTVHLTIDADEYGRLSPYQEPPSG
jgi:PRC-barrel domain protein